MNILETHVLEIIGEDTDSPDVFTDDLTGMAQIRDSLNDAIEEISMLTGGHVGKIYLPLKSDAVFYRIRTTTDSFAWITDAWLPGQKRRLERTDLIRLNQFNPRWMKNSGAPQSYFVVGENVVGFWPIVTSDTDIVEFTCVLIPARYVLDTDRIKLRNDYKWAAVHFAVGEFYASRGDAKTAKYHHKIYLDKLGVQSVYPESSERLRYYQTQKEVWPKATD